MSRLPLLTEAQMRCLKPFFQLPAGFGGSMTAASSAGSST